SVGRQEANRGTSMSIRTSLRGLAISLCAVTALPLAARASSGDIKLPKILPWTAYDVGSTGYTQGVGMGSTFKNKLGVTVRILPGKHDVSLPIPLREGKADYSLTGTSDVLYAQEGMYTFGDREWGPQSITQIITTVSDATPAMG